MQSIELTNQAEEVNKQMELRKTGRENTRIALEEKRKLEELEQAQRDETRRNFWATYHPYEIKSRYISFEYKQKLLKNDLKNGIDVPGIVLKDYCITDPTL